MARKITDTYPQITITVGGEVPKFTPYHMSEAEAWNARDEILELINTVLQRTTRRQLDVETQIVRESACEHCNSRWTEDGPDYNGGCCGKDAANDPERLAALRKLADTVSGGDYVRIEDDRRPSRQTCDWPWALAVAAMKWLDDGRPADGVAELLPLIARVELSDWGTWWDDPGDYPSNAGSGSLPSRCEPQAEPAELASDLAALIDDMGLVPAMEAA